MQQDKRMSAGMNLRNLNLFDTFGTFTPTGNMTVINKQGRFWRKNEALDKMRKSLLKPHVYKPKKAISRQKRSNKKIKAKTRSSMSKALLLSMKSGRMPSEWESKEIISESTISRKGYLNSTRKSLPGKIKDMNKHKIPYKESSRSYYKVLQTKHPFMIPANCRNESTVTQAHSNRYSARQKEVSLKVNYTANAPPKSTKKTISKDIGPDLSSSYNFAKSRFKK